MHPQYEINNMKSYIIVIATGCLLLFFTACGNNRGRNFAGFFDDSDDGQSKEFYEGLLEKFCQDYYDDLYHDYWGTRSYVHGSLKVDSVHQSGEREVMVYGTHDFEGRLGHIYRGYKFRANVYESKKSTHDYIITFEKESKKIISRRSYSESRTKTIHYEK